MLENILKPSGVPDTVFVDDRVRCFMKIQKKLILIFSTSIFLFVCIGILSNYFFMEHYYMYNARIEFVELSKTLQEKIESQSHGVETYVKKYGKKENVRIVILNRDLEVEMTSLYLRKDGSNIPQKKIRQLVKKKGTDAYICEIYEQKKKKSAKMFFLSETENGQYLLFMKNADGVSESAAIANKFYLVIGIGIWLIGSAVTVVFSKKISEPIVRMSEVTAAMARLQFETKIEEKGNDEIRDLAHSINRNSCARVLQP